MSMIARRDLIVDAAALAAATCLPLAAPAQRRVDNLTAWFQDARFGLFLHWGLYSVAAGRWKGEPIRGAEHFMLYHRIPLKEYATLADRFDPRRFDADVWVAMAIDAGMKYLVITTKHHEGFAMYDSASSDYNIVKRTPYHRDPIRAIADACHRRGLKLGFYYSLGRDWQDPDVPTNWPTKAGRSNTWDFPDEDAKRYDQYFARKARPQIRELLTNYGQVDIMWFDTPELTPPETSREIREMIKTLQPQCIINERIGNRMGDYGISEQNLAPPTFQPNGAWEACVTMSAHWAYFADERAWKSTDVLIRNLVVLASEGGNYLLNVGPSPLGEFPLEARERLAAIGRWIKLNGHGIYGTRRWTLAGETSSGAPIAHTLPGRHMVDAPAAPAGASVGADAINDRTSQSTPPEIRYTTRDNDVFAFLMNWNESSVNLRALGSSAGEVRAVRILDVDGRIRWRQDRNELFLEIPPASVTSAGILTVQVTMA